MHNKEILAASKSWSTRSGSKSEDSVNSDGDDSIETKSLPPNNSKDWHPTVPKPFSFTLKYDKRSLYLKNKRTEYLEIIIFRNNE